MGSRDYLMNRNVKHKAIGIFTHPIRFLETSFLVNKIFD